MATNDENFEFELRMRNNFVHAFDECCESRGGSRWEGFVDYWCTRPKAHDGDHVAHDTKGNVLATWSDA